MLETTISLKIFQHDRGGDCPLNFWALFLCLNTFGCQASSNPVNTIFDVKRLIGRTSSDAAVKADVQSFPFTGTIARPLKVYESEPNYGHGVRLSCFCVFCVLTSLAFMVHLNQRDVLMVTFSAR